MWRLMETFTNPANHKLVDVYYFTAIAEWLINPAKRHKKFIRAQEACGVKVILGSFKEKSSGCKTCGTTWISHEEKQTDVNIAVTMIREAYNDNFDEAFIVSQDSDFAPALQVINGLSKKRKIKLISPPGFRHSKELGQYAHKTGSIKIPHLENCRMPFKIEDTKTKYLITTRPEKYKPPTTSTQNDN